MNNINKKLQASYALDVRALAHMEYLVGISKVQPTDQLLSKSTNVFWFNYKNQRIALNNNSSSNYMIIKDTVLGKIGDYVKTFSLKKFGSCNINKESLGKIAFVLFHTSYNSGNLLDFINNDILGPQYFSEHSIMIEYIIRNLVKAICRVGDLTELYILNQEFKPNDNIIKALNSDNYMSEIGELPIIDVIYQNNKIVDFNKFEPEQRSRLIQYIKSLFTNLLAIELKDDAIYDYFLNKLMYTCDPKKCTFIREDDDVMGDLFIGYKMKQLNTIINIDGYCFSVSYLASAIIGTRGNITPVLKGASLSKDSKELIVRILSNYYALNPKDFSEILASLKSYNETELNILTKHQLIESNLSKTRKDFDYCRRFFSYMIEDFGVELSTVGVTDLYVNTNGLIVDLIGFVGYVCLSDNITAQANSIVQFDCAQHCISKLLEFLKKFENLKDFKVNKDSLDQIVTDIPSTCIHGIGKRLLSFYIGLFHIIDNIVKEQEYNKLVYVPPDYDISEEEYRDLVYELLEPANFLYRYVDKDQVPYYYTCVSDEFDPDFHPNGKRYHCMEFDKEGVIGQWVGQGTSIHCFSSTQPTTVNDFFGRRDVKETMTFEQLTNLQGFTRFKTNSKNILFIAELLQKDRKQVFNALLEHTNNVMEINKSVNSKNSKNAIDDTITEPLLYRNLIKINNKNNNSKTGKYRSFDMLYESHYLLENNELIVKNAYANRGDFKEDSQKVQLLARIFKRIGPKNVNIANPLTVENDLKSAFHSLDNAASTVLSSSSLGTFNIFHNMKINMKGTELTYGNIPAIMMFKNNEPKNEFNNLITNIMQFITPINVPTYLKKIVDIKKKITEKENIITINLLENEIKSRVIILSHVSHGFLIYFLQSPSENYDNLQGNVPLVKEFKIPSHGQKLADFCSNYYNCVFYAWLCIVNLQYQDDLISTQSFHIDNIVREYQLLIKFWNSNEKQSASNVKYPAFTGTSSIYAESLAFMNENYAYYKELKLEKGDNQESIPSRVNFVLKAAVANSLNTYMLLYNQFKTAVNENIFNESDLKIEDSNVDLKKVLDQIF
jgi:hypothetical protein